MNTPILTLEKVSLQKEGKPILQEISTTLFPGDSVIISGPSGAGKTSLLRLLARMEEPSSGGVYFHQRPLSQYPAHEYRRRVGLVFQTPVFFPGSVLENLQQVDRINHRPLGAETRYEAVLHQVGLASDKRSQEALSLSLGEKQRLAIARTLLNDPEILLLDEPISALDSAAATHLLQALATLHQQTNLTFLMVTHQMPAIPLGNRTWQISQGRLLAEGLP